MSQYVSQLVTEIVKKFGPDILRAIPDALGSIQEHWDDYTSDYRSAQRAYAARDRDVFATLDGDHLRDFRQDRARISGGWLIDPTLPWRGAHYFVDGLVYAEMDPQEQEEFKRDGGRPYAALYPPHGAMTWKANKAHQQAARRQLLSDLDARNNEFLRVLRTEGGPGSHLLLTRTATPEGTPPVSPTPPLPATPDVAERG